MSKKTIIAMVLVAGISTLAISSQAFAYHGMNSNYADGTHHYATSQVPALTAEQQSALDKLRTEYQGAIAPTQKELVVKQAEYQALMRQTNPDPAAAGKMAGELADIRTKMANAANAHRTKVAETLGIDPAAYTGHMGGMGMMGGAGMGAMGGAGMGAANMGGRGDMNYGHNNGHYGNRR